MNRPRGRPKSDTGTPSRESMEEAALQILDTGGSEAFTMRAVAERLGVNPMTIHHHFGGRNGLIKALADRVYSAVTAPETGDCLRRIESLLHTYHASVIRHPELALLIFSGPDVFPKQAQRITDDISTLLADMGLERSKLALWVSILVDFTHGAAIATAMAVQDEHHGAPPGTGNGYAETLAELLKAMQGRT